MPHPTTGSPDYDTTIYHRVGNTINIVRSRQGKTAELGQAVIVPGKTYTVTAEGIAVNGQQYHYVYVFDRHNKGGIHVLHHRYPRYLFCHASESRRNAQISIYLPRNGRASSGYRRCRWAYDVFGSLCRACDYIKGSGPFVIYGGLTLADGSTLWYKTNGMSATQSAKANVKGTIAIVGGNGRFEGAKGDGTFAGARLHTTAAGVQVYADIMLNIKK
jgi:hypothetical protein